MEKLLSRFPLRISLPIILLLIATLFSLYTYLTDIQAADQRVEREATFDVTTQMNLLQSSLERDLRRNDLESIRIEIATAGSAREIKAIFLADSRNKVIAATRFDAIGKSAETTLPPYSGKSWNELFSEIDRVRSQLAGATYLDAQRHSLIALYPVQFSVTEGLRPATGYLLMQYDLTRLKTLERQIIEHQVFEITLFLWGLILLLWLFFYFAVTRRANEVIEITNRFARGEVQARTGMKGNDELSLLGLAFDRMADNILQSQKGIRQLAAIVESSDDAIIGKDLNNIITNWNEGAQRLYGYTAAETIGKPISLIVPADKRQELQELSDRIKQGERVKHHETRRITKDSQLLHISLTLSPLFDEQGKIVGISAIGRDFTERKRAEETIRKNNELLEKVFSSIHVMIAYLDREFNFIKVNRAYAAADQREPDFYPGKNHFDLYPNEENKAIFQKVVETGEPIVYYAKPFEYAEHPERGVSYWDWRAEPLKGPDGKVEGLIFSLLNVTEQTLARKKIEEAEEQLRLITDSVPALIAYVDSEKRYQFNNRGFEEWFSRPRSEMRGKYIWEVIGEPAYEKVRQYVDRALSGEQVTFESLIPFKDGQIRYVSATYVPNFGPQKEVTGFFALVSDITERRKAEEALMQTAARLNEAQRIAHIGSWELDLVHNILTWSDEIYRMFEIDPQKFGASYEAFLEAIHPDDREAVNFAYTNSLKTKTPYAIDHRLRFADGRIKYVHEQCETFYDEEGKPIRSVGTVQDITERKLAEEALRHLSQRNELILNSAGEGIYGTDVEGNITFVNPAAAKMLGFSSEDLIGKNSHRVFHHTKADGQPYPISECPLHKSLKEGSIYRGEVEVFWTKSGQKFDVENVNTPLVEEGKIVGAVVVFRDITERKRAQESLRLAYAYNRSLIEASLDPLVTIGPDGKITDVNSATEQATGYPREKLIGTDFSDYFTEPEKAKAGYLRVFETGAVRDYALEIRHKEGKVTPVLYNATLYRDEAGKVMGIFAAARDVMELKRVEEELRRLNVELEHRIQERTAQLQEANKELEAFAYSVSHDLRAPLRHIDGFVELLTRHTGTTLDEKGQHYVRTIQESAKRMDVLISDILTFSRAGRAEMRLAPVPLNPLFQEVIAGFQLETEKRKVVWNIGPLPEVQADAALLRQVIENLVSNALKFTRTREEAKIEIGFSDRADETIVYVRDNGVGFDMQYKDRLFGVFQRLHSEMEFEGTGIGLANVKRIITRHGGRVWAEGETGKGATFYFSLPKK